MSNLRACALVACLALGAYDRDARASTLYALQDGGGAADILWQFDLANPNNVDSFLPPLASYTLPQNIFGGFPISSMLGIAVSGNTLYALQDGGGAADILWQFDLANPNNVDSFLPPLASYTLPVTILGDAPIRSMIGIAVPSATDPQGPGNGGGAVTVPEPSGLAVIGAALGLLLGVRRRRHAPRP